MLNIAVAVGLVRNIKAQKKTVALPFAGPHRVSRRCSRSAPAGGVIVRKYLTPASCMDGATQ